MAAEVLDYFTEGYEPVAGGFDPKIDSLADGHYDFTILGSAIDQAQDGTVIFRLNLGVEQNRAKVQHDYWFNRQESVNRFGADMQTLGFNVASIAGLKQIVAATETGQDMLRGKRFSGHKDSYEKRDGSGQAHVLRFTSKLPDHGSNGQAPPSGPASKPAPGQPNPYKQPIQQPVSPQPAEGEFYQQPKDDIPF